MAISVGTRLGPYEILAPLGAGGMGEVWRARDTRLDRSVAIKLLPAEFSTNAQLRLRLEREAKTISQLNDPHICTLYDVGHENGYDYLVMEYLDGETLADRISRGPLPLADVIRYGVQIATALERAHAAGIVHRDLKPGNVMLTKSGAKLLDFGLAKSTESSVLGPRSSVSATEHKPLTAEGSIVGTFQYMAPEQLEGEEADARTDIFALGTILYEMATGRRAFDGKTRTSLIAAIVDRDPPPISSFQPLTPRRFERVVKTSLAKNRADRWQSAHDVRLELQWLSDEEDTQIAPRKRNRLAWSVAALLALIALGAIAMLIRAKMTALPQPPVRTSILPNEGAVFEFYIEGGPPDLSPDGKKIAYVASLNGSGLGVTPSRTLWMRPLDSTVAQSLNGTEGASQPFWSPDKKYVGFYADGALKKIEATGGAPVTICASGTVRGGTWNRDGAILVGHASGPITRVAAAGGQFIDVTELDRGQRDTSHRFPSFLPDGKHFLFLAGPHVGDEAADVICIGSIEKKMRKPLIHATSSALYYEGWILFARDRVLTAQRFDPEKLEMAGDPVALSEQRVETDSTTGRAFFSIAQDGTLVYQTGSGIRESQLTWFDRTGKEIGKVGEPQRYGQIAMSRDARYIAYSTVARQNIWMIDSLRGTTTRLTLADARETAPVWSPDGTQLVYSSMQGGDIYNLYIKDIRTGSERPLVVNDHDKNPTSWSSDGQTIFYTEQTFGPRKADIMYFSFADGKSHVFLASPYEESGARISPDGKWVVYQSSETPPLQIYIAPFPPTGAKWQVSTRSAINARWRSDGKELFFNAVGKFVAVPIAASTTVELGQPVNLFDARFGGAASWDVTADGKRFLVNGIIGGTPAPPPLTLVQHFDTELRAAAERHE